MGERAAFPRGGGFPSEMELCGIAIVYKIYTSMKLTIHQILQENLSKLKIRQNKVEKQMSILTKKNNQWNCLNQLFL